LNHAPCEQIHETSLALLEDPGIKLEHDEVYQRLRKAGARPGNAARVLRLPRAMVAEYLALAPHRIILADRRGRQVELSAHSAPLYWTCPGMFLEEKGQVRPFTSADMAAITRLADALDNVHGVFGMALDDVPPLARDFVGLRIMAENTGKHLRALCFGSLGIEAMLEMRHVVGDSPWFSIGFTAHGPLRWTHLALDIFLKSAGHCIPTTINGEPMAGASGPVTLAGSLALGNAEILAGIVVNQALEPGRPCIHNLGLAHVMDMRSAIAVTGGPENALMAAAAAAMARFYDLPSCSWVSTEAMAPEAQAALEKMFGFLVHSQAGVSLIWGVGQLESEMTISPTQMVIDNEMISFIRHYLKGLPVTERTLALDTIRKVGISGSFLDAEHTLRHYRDHLYHPALLWRQRRTTWEAQGMPTLQVAAQHKARALMAEARSVPCPDESQRRALQEIEHRFISRIHSSDS